MTAARIPEEPFAPEDTRTCWRVRGAKVLKIATVAYGLMEIPGPDGRVRLARVGPRYSAWYQKGAIGAAPEDVDFDVSEREIEAAARWENATAARRRPSAKLSLAGSGVSLQRWGVHAWGKSEIECPHCKIRFKPSMKLVEFDVLFRRGDPAAFHCPSCFEDAGFVDFFDFEDARAHWDDLSAESRKIALLNAEIRRQRSAPRLLDAAQLPEVEGEELRFTLRSEKRQVGFAIVLALGDRVVWSQPSAAESEGLNFYARVAAILKERYGPRVRDVVPTPEVLVALAGTDARVYQDMESTPGQIRGTDQSVRRLRQKLFGASAEEVAGASPGLEEQIAARWPKPKAVPRPACPWVAERRLQGSLPRKGRRARKRHRESWQALQAVREDQALQAKHPISEAKERFGECPHPCPGCGAVGEQLAWFYFESPPLTWAHLCGRAGWIVVCDRCQRRVASLGTVIS